MGVGLLAGQPAWASRANPIVGAAGPPAESERFLLQVLAQQAAVALANAHLHQRERKQAVKLRTANLALERGMEIHDRLTRVALAGEGQEGIARALYELTNRAVAIEDRFGNLRVWAGPDQPETYPRADPRQRELILVRAMAAVSPVRDEDRLVSVAVLGGDPIGVLVLRDADGTAGDFERMAIEHATTVLTMELARVQSLTETATRLRTNLVLELVEGADRTGSWTGPRPSATTWASRTASCWPTVTPPTISTGSSTR